MIDKEWFCGGPTCHFFGVVSLMFKYALFLSKNIVSDLNQVSVSTVLNKAE